MTPTKAAAAMVEKVFYPSSDGEPMAETGLHVMLMVTLIPTLRYFFRGQPDVYVIGNIFLYYEEGNSDAKRSPDVMVVKGAKPEKEERTSYFLWEEGVPPAAVIELTSMKTADEDVGPKRRLYERLKVREYFLFDPLLHLLDVPLTGYRLVGSKYQTLHPAEDGSLESLELGLRLVPEGTELVLFDLRTGERVPTPPAAYELLEEKQRELQEQRQRAEKEKQRAEKERQRAEKEARAKEEAQREAEALRAEVARLKARKPRKKPPGNR